MDGGAHALHHVAEGFHLTLYGVTLVLFATVRRWRPAAFQLYLAAGVPTVVISAVLLRRLTPAHERRSLLAGGGFSAPLAALALSAAVPVGRYP